jgi:hypothetical protein
LLILAECKFNIKAQQCFCLFLPVSIAVGRQFKPSASRVVVESAETGRRGGRPYGLAVSQPFVGQGTVAAGCRGKVTGPLLRREAEHAAFKEYARFATIEYIPLFNAALDAYH